MIDYFVYFYELCIIVNLESINYPLLLVPLKPNSQIQTERHVGICIFQGIMLHSYFNVAFLGLLCLGILSHEHVWLAFSINIAEIFNWQCVVFVSIVIVVGFCEVFVLQSVLY